MNPNPARYRSALWLVPVGLLLSGFSAFAEMQTRIVSINGSYALAHETSITVQPGDTVALTADQVDLDYNGGEIAQNRNVEDFTYSSDASSNDSCDPNYDCTGSNFETTAYGVSFYVPYGIGQSIVVTVQNRTDGTYDQVTLVNGSYTSSYTPPSSSYSDPTEYPSGDDFDYNKGLAGHGRWVYIDGERVFVPYNYVSDWQPYQNGHWYWTSYGWTWQSYDPWGWVTDHYGYWRHHHTYGWTWQALPENRWQPAVVSWFHTEQGVGWSPYWSAYERGYVKGRAAGYDDGYWEGYRAGLNNGYRWGGTYVYSSNFVGVNIYGVRVAEVGSVYSGCYNERRYGNTLIDARYSNPRVFIEARIGRPVVVTQTNVVVRGRVQFVQPAQRFEIPATYRQVAQAARERVVRRSLRRAILLRADRRGRPSRRTRSRASRLRVVRRSLRRAILLRAGRRGRPSRRTRRRASRLRAVRRSLRRAILLRADRRGRLSRRSRLRAILLRADRHSRLRAIPLRAARLARRSPRRASRLRVVRHSLLRAGRRTRLRAIPLLAVRRSLLRADRRTRLRAIPLPAVRRSLLPADRPRRAILLRADRRLRAVLIASQNHPV
ncbi:MAG: hypothetical protein HY075_11080 [Deltaproteobacteria bacterium]|nr:hypothetical protein [Deltaproteobacteria bacterium]